MPPLPPDAKLLELTKGSDRAALRIQPPELDTLRVRPDFLRAASARRQGAGSFLLQARQRAAAELPDQRIRVGYTCSKKIGNAVVRNRAKRRLRALAREIFPTMGQAGWDYVLVARPGATVSRSFPDLRQDLVQALQRVHHPKTPKAGA